MAEGNVRHLPCRRHHVVHIRAGGGQKGSLGSGHCGVDCQDLRLPLHDQKTYALTIFKTFKFQTCPSAVRATSV